MSDPQISVVMPAYNAEKYIAEAIDSIIAQTFNNFEFIIINDASTDSTKGIIKSYKDPRIKLISNEQNQGVAKSLNFGVAAAKGKYIARMDADDISLPQRFQTQFDFMEQNPDIDVCGSWAKTFGDKEELIKTYQTHEEIRDETFFYCSMIHPSAMFRNTNTILYSEDRASAQDYDLWSRMIDTMKFANIPEVLLLYRVHNEQIGVAKKAEQDINANNIKFRNIENIGLSLSDEEKRIYLEILNWTFSPKNKKELLLAAKMLDNISVSGAKHGYKQLFQDTIQNFMKNLPERGLQNKVTSLKLYFTTFRNWQLFETPRANLRYIYHCFRNLLHV